MDRMTGLYNIAEQKICITSIYDEVHRLCKEYRTEENSYGKDSDGSCNTADLYIQATREDIEFERSKSIREDEREGIPIRLFSDEYLETLAVYRKIAEKMPSRDTILFHGSCIAADGTGYLFTAKSGTGKSTHTRLWRELLGNRAVMVNDDKPLIRLTGGGSRAGEEVRIYGTPWDGKHRLSSNISVPLKSVCILTRAEKNRIVPISVSEAYPMLIQQVYRPADPEAMRMTLDLIDRLAASADLWRLECNTDPDAARVSFEAMKG